MRKEGEKDKNTRKRKDKEKEKKKERRKYNLSRVLGVSWWGSGAKGVHSSLVLPLSVRLSPLGSSPSDIVRVGGVRAAGHAGQYFFVRVFVRSARVLQLFALII